jgi:hypothetical protein
MNADLIFNAIGLIGPVLFVWAYLQLSLGHWNAGMMKPHVLNLIGACAVMVSLTHHMNLPTFALEVCWAAISVYGMVRAKKE